MSAVSVVIPHYGDPEPTQTLIKRLQAQKGGGITEIIVSDDASPEPFAEIEGCIVVRSEKNGGFGSAVNAGAAAAAGDLLLILNSDIDISDTFVQELVDGAAPWQPAVVAPSILEADFVRCVGKRWPGAWSNSLETLDILARFHGNPQFEGFIGNDPDTWETRRAVLTDWVIGVCMLIPRAHFEHVGGLDTRFFMNCEETDLQKRLHDECGLPAVVLPEPVIRHVGGGSSDTSKRSDWLTYSRFRYYEKWHGGPGLLIGLLSANSVNLVSNSLRQATGRDVNAIGTFKAQQRRILDGWRNRK